MITEETHAEAEGRLGRKVHFHQGVWWARAGPFYYKPVHEFRSFPPRAARPHPLKALLGYSHQVPAAGQGTRWLRYNILQGEELRDFSLDRLGGKRRNQVRMGNRNCRLEDLERSDATLEQMRMINISQAKRFEGKRTRGTFLPAEYYEARAARWRQDTLSLFDHPGHWFVGAYVGAVLAAYVNLIRVEDSWMFGAVKSHGDFLQYRPVDALYFEVLSMASRCAACKRVVNGGADGEPHGLTHFKEEFLLRAVAVPYYSHAVIPIAKLRGLQRRIMRGR